MKAVAYGSWLFVSILWFLWERHRQRKSWREGCHQALPLSNLPSPNYFRASWTAAGANGLCGTTASALGINRHRRSSRTMHCDVDTENPMHGDHDRGADGPTDSDEYRDEGEKEDDMREDETKSTYKRRRSRRPRRSANSPFIGWLNVIPVIVIIGRRRTCCQRQRRGSSGNRFLGSCRRAGREFVEAIKVRRSPSSFGACVHRRSSFEFSSSALESFIRPPHLLPRKLSHLLRRVSRPSSAFAERPRVENTGARASRSRFGGGPTAGDRRMDDWPCVILPAHTLEPRT